MNNKYKYINNYNKEHYKQFKATISKDDYDKLKKLLEKKKMSNADFIRWSIIMLDKYGFEV